MFLDKIKTAETSTITVTCGKVSAALSSTQLDHVGWQERKKLAGQLRQRLFYVTALGWRGACIVGLFTRSGNGSPRPRVLPSAITRRGELTRSWVIICLIAVRLVRLVLWDTVWAEYAEQHTPAPWFISWESLGGSWVSAGLAGPSHGISLLLVGAGAVRLATANRASGSWRQGPGDKKSTRLQAISRDGVQRSSEK